MLAVIATIRLFVVSMMMRHSALLHSRLSAPLSSQCDRYEHGLAFSLCKFSLSKHSLCVLTSLCLLLTGCDSGSATSSVGMDKQATSNTTNLSVKNAASIEQHAVTDLHTSNTSDSSNNSQVNDSARGQSLMSASKIDNGADVQRTPMISEGGTDSTLQATLIGDYKGMLPCKFCDGINMTLNLLSDGSVLKTSIYENPEMPTAPLIESGVYRQDNHTIIVVYDDKNIEMYRIENNHLIMLDENKKPNPDYTLSRK